MYHFTIPMALMDFIPVAFFAVSAVLLLKSLYGKMGVAAYVLLAAGNVQVFTAGFCKALWKLLYAANVCDFVALEEMFMPVNSLGLLFAGVGLVLYVCQRKRAVLSVAPPVVVSSMPFIGMMVLGLGGICVALSILSVRLKKAPAMVWFILSFVCAMGMGYMSSQDSTQSWVNWVEQSINCVSQLCLMVGVIVLHKAGMGEPRG